MRDQCESRDEVEFAPGLWESAGPQFRYPGYWDGDPWDVVPRPLCGIVWMIHLRRM